MDLLGIDRIMTNEQLEDMMVVNMIKQIENEYAQQYLEHLGVGGTEQNVLSLISEQPLSACEIQTSGWDNLTEMIDTVVVTPTAKKP